MRLSITEALSRRKVEVANDLVDADAAFDAAALAALLVQLLAVVFALALFDVFAAAEGPGDGGVGFADFGAGVAAAGFYGVGRGGGAVALAAVFGVEVGGFVFVAGEGVDQYVCFVEEELQAYSLSGFVSSTWLPSDLGESLILLMPCMTSLWTSPETSMTSKVNSSHGIRGNVMFMCISIFSPRPLSTTSSGATVILR